MQRFHVRLRYQRGVLFSLLLCMLLGSLLGSFCFLLSEWTLSFEELRLPGSSPLHYAFLRILIFPALMSVSLRLFALRMGLGWNDRSAGVYPLLYSGNIALTSRTAAARRRLV